DLHSDGPLHLQGARGAALGPTPPVSADERGPSFPRTFLWASLRGACRFPSYHTDHQGRQSCTTSLRSARGARSSSWRCQSPSRVARILPCDWDCAPGWTASPYLPYPSHWSLDATTVH